MSKSRKDKIISFLNSLSKDGDNEIKNRVNEILKEVDALEEVKLKSKHVYLYFMQLGYNVYTGEKIDLEKVLNSETYDIDHIVPKSLRYDDSIDNTVLVDRETNQKIKKDLYPLPESLYTEKNIKLWKMLNRNKEMMSDIKLAALMRRSEMTLDEIEDFINRQINVVNYSNVAIRDVINILYKNTTVIFSKAKFASYLRDEYNIHKHRGINDTHHGVDAFLNIVAGNILYDYFSSFRRIYETEHKFINSYMEAVLYLKTAEMKSKIVDTANKHNIIVTYGLSYVDSEFYKQTIYGANNKEGKTKLIPIHTKDNSPFNNIKLYGGYDQLTTSCLYWVSYNLKGKRYKELVAIKLLYEKLFAKDESSLIKTISETCFKKKVENLQILRKIQINQKIKVFNGVFCLCTKGDSLNLKNAYQTYFDFDILYYINKGLKVLPSDNEESLISYKSGRKEKEIIFSKDKNKAIFELAVNKTHEKQYSEISYLQNYQNISVQRFMQYTVREQIEILNEMLVGFSYNARASKLQSKFKIGGECICIKSFKTIDDNVLLIRESVTGLYCKVEKI